MSWKGLWIHLADCKESKYWKCYASYLNKYFLRKVITKVLNSFAEQISEPAKGEITTLSILGPFTELKAFKNSSSDADCPNCVSGLDEGN